MIRLLEIYKETLLKEIDFKSVEPFSITPTKKSISNDSIVFTAYTKLKDSINIEHQIVSNKPKEYTSEVLVEANCMFKVNGDIDIEEYNKNLLGFRGLLQLYRTSFLFIQNSLDDYNNACIDEWNPDGIIYIIQAADKDSKKEEKKANVYSNYIDFTFDDTYERYKKGTKFELLKYFDDDE